jgi:hypothetical protein
METSKESEKCETSVKEGVDVMSGKTKRNKCPSRKVFTTSHMTPREAHDQSCQLKNCVSNTQRIVWNIFQDGLDLMLNNNGLEYSPG